MLIIINADDWGGWKSATNAALACYEQKRISSVTAMMFMEDSERAAELAKAAGLDVGLHLNFNQSFSSRNCPPLLARQQDCTRRFLKRSKYAQLFYNPFLRKQFRYVYQAQVEEFHRLYGKPPSHMDGHQHMHLCSNMLLDGIIPRGQKVRRSFSFWPGEKSSFNRIYRSAVDRMLARRYRTTDYFFSLAQCLQFNRLPRVEEVAKTANVELMAHPEKPEEYQWLMSDDCAAMLRRLRVVSYAAL
jgi:predicted glycoside hydrolase/deacetylase ChbG (UPF0249 family)